MERHRKAAGAVTAAVVILVAVLLFWGGVGSKESGADETPDTTTTSTIVDEGTTTTSAPEPECDAQFTIQHDENKHNKVLSAGLEGQPREVIDQLVAYAGHDERALAYMWEYTPQGTKVDPATLREGGCLNEEGRKIWYQVKGAWDSATVEMSEAPANGVNTGMTEGGYVQAESAGIRGDRKAVKVTFKNGDVLWVMHRCANIVTLEHRPDVPKGPTDNPPPETPTTTTTVPPCPPRTHLTPEGCEHDSVRFQPDPPTPRRQDPQNNRTSGVNVGPTPGAPATPPTNTAPRPADNRTVPGPAPDPTPSGSNSGSPDGSGTPSGSVGLPGGGGVVGPNITSPPQRDDGALQDNSPGNNHQEETPSDNSSEISNPF